METEPSFESSKQLAAAKASRVMHHIVPVMHLKRFVGSDPKGQVWIYPKLSGKIRSSIPEETATERHFYSIERPDGSFDNSIESMLSVIEGGAEAPYEKLINGEVPSGSDRMNFAAFAAIMYLRTRPARRMSAELYSRMYQLRNYATAIHDGAFNSLIKRMEEGEGKVLDAEQRDLIRSTMKDPSGFQISIPKQDTLDIFETAKIIMPLLCDMTWSILTPKHGFFVTSDHPLRRSVVGRTHPIFGDGGFKHKNVEVSFPLSPQKLVVMTWNKDLPKRFSVSKEFLVDRNIMRIQGAETEIYSHLRRGGIEKLVKKFAKHKLDVGGGHFPEQKLMQTVVPRKWDWKGR